MTPFEKYIILRLFNHYVNNYLILNDYYDLFDHHVMNDLHHSVSSHECDHDHVLGW